MATNDKKISELTPAADVTGEEIIPFALDGKNGSLTSKQLQEYVSVEASATAEDIMDIINKQ